MRRTTLIACSLVLATIAISSYLHSERKAEQAVRTEDALVLQQAIHAYTVEKGHAPQSLNDLVVAGYLKAIPGHPPEESDPIVLPKGRT